MYGESDDKPKIYYEILSKRNELESYLKKLEKSIYDCETKYLEGSQTTGNIIKGWDHIFTAKSKLSSTTAQSLLKRTKFSNNERIFSQTSFHNSSLKEDGGSVTNILKNVSMSNNNFDNSKDNFIRKKLKKKIYSSLSIKKKKLGGIHMNANKNIDHLNN
jgi:hypothetical protein